MQLRVRVRRRKHMCLHRGLVPQAHCTHERWSLDRVYDQLSDSRPFRILTVVDQVSRPSPVIEPRHSFGGGVVPAVLDRATARSGRPVPISVDHGTAFTSRALEDWAYRRRLKLDFIRPGMPIEIGHIESFNDQLRDECLNVMQFLSIDDARAKIEARRIDYNAHRSHSSLGNLTPSEFARKRQGNRTAEVAGL